MEFPAWLNASALGLIVLMAVFGWIWFKPAVDRLLGDHARVIDQRDKLIDVYAAEVIPALKEATTAAAKMIDLVEDVAETDAQVRELLIEVRAMLHGREGR